MEYIALFIPLMIAAVNSSGQILTAFVSKTKETVAKTKEAVNNYIFDKSFVEKVVFDSTEQLANLVNTTSAELKEEIREQSILEAIHDLQAHIISIGSLLKLVEAEEIDPKFAERLISNGLYPLQVSLVKAEQRLKYYKKDDIWLYCCIIGTNTLIAGYAFLGQNPPSLQKNLEDSIFIFQKYLLDSIAHISTKSNIPIPWEKIPRLITIDGFGELIELYNSVTVDDTVEQREIIINTRKESLRAFLEILRGAQERDTKNSHTTNSLVAKRLLYKLENMVNHSSPQKSSIDISLTKDEWSNLSNILTAYITVIKPNRKDWSDWLAQTIARIKKGASIE